MGLLAGCFSAVVFAVARDQLRKRPAGWPLVGPCWGFLNLGTEPRRGCSWAIGSTFLWCGVRRVVLAGSRRLADGLRCSLGGRAVAGECPDLRTWAADGPASPVFQAHRLHSYQRPEQAAVAPSGVPGLTCGNRADRLRALLAGGGWLGLACGGRGAGLGCGARSPPWRCRVSRGSAGGSVMEMAREAGFLVSFCPSPQAVSGCA